MKKSLRLLPVLMMFIGLMWTLEVNAQGPPPPPPDGHGATGNQPPTGGNAPIGSGMAILLALGAAYAGKKAYAAHSEKQ
ncbi:MAG: hypothetical protein FD170_3723 [Bacteroidetes bacterium]|nr:MAG: hypothetical protein FD170_3723 [Bacteroidota bacterium]